MAETEAATGASVKRSRSEMEEDDLKIGVGNESEGSEWREVCLQIRY